MCTPDHVVPGTDPRIARTKTDRLLHQRDRFLQWAGPESAMAEAGYCTDRITIVCNHRLVFGNGFLVSALCTKYLAFGKVHERAVRSCRKGLRNKLIGAVNVGSARAGHLVEDTEYVHIRQ